MVKPSVLTKLWNSTCASIAIINRTIGLHYYPLPNSHITMHASHTTTGISPFFANKGYSPNLTIHPNCDLALARAQDYVTDLDELHQELRHTILEAQQAYQTSADVHCLPTPEFPIGSFAYVKAKFFWTTRPSKKLAKKFLGPFEVIAHHGTYSFTLRLPDHM
jgi:hypothetical protein